MYIIKLLKYDIKHIVYAIFCSVMIMANCSNCLCSTSISDVIAGGKFKRADLARKKRGSESLLTDGSGSHGKTRKRDCNLLRNCFGKDGGLVSSDEDGVINENVSCRVVTPGPSCNGIIQPACKSMQQAYKSKAYKCDNGHDDVLAQTTDDASNVDQESASGFGATIPDSHHAYVQKSSLHEHANHDVSVVDSDDTSGQKAQSGCNTDSSRKIEISTRKHPEKSYSNTSVIFSPTYNYFNNDILNKSMYIDNMRGLAVNMHKENEMISDFIQYDYWTSLKIGTIFIPRFTFSIYNMYDLYSNKTGYDEIIDSKKNAIQNVKAGIVKRDSPAPVIRNRSSSLVKRNVQLSVKKIILELKNNKNISDKEILYAIRKLAILKTKYRDKNSRMYVNKIIKKLQELRKPLLQNNKCVGLNVKRKVYENGDIFAS